jgi:hypothetical protein
VIAAPAVGRRRLVLGRDLAPGHDRRAGWSLVAASSVAPEGVVADGCILGYAMPLVIARKLARIVVKRDADGLTG